MSTVGLWYPEPIYSSDKTAFRNIYDTKTRTYWVMKDCENPLTSDIPNATGTYAMMKFYVPMNENDETDQLLAFVQRAKAALDEFIWVAERDMAANGADLKTADGQVLKGFLEQGKTDLVNG